jgi:cellulose synthase/poly-beta-1,6-N-acetylglucosamine synthase-like glycosyltransferase
LREGAGRLRRQHTESNRLLEVLPGLCTWLVLTSLIWASFLKPLGLALAILAYDTYWLYRSTSLAIRIIVAYRRLRRSEAFDWLSAAAALPEYGRVHHLLIVPTYGESVDILRATLRRLTEQDFPLERMAVVLAFEARDPRAQHRAQLLSQEFEGQFGWLWTTFHPKLPREVAGKSSNEAWAARWAKERLIDDCGVDLEFTTVTTCDADSRFSPKYFSALTYEFLTKPRLRMFQPVIQFYNNIWRVPAPSRVLNSVHSLWQLAKLTRVDKLVPQSTYSLSLQACVEAGYWDVDVIPEDSHMFFKMMFHFGREVRVEPIYLPVVSDAAERPGYVSTLWSQFEQEKRWAWGVADIPYVLLGLGRTALRRGLGRWYRGLRYVEEHLSWPLSPFLITFGASAPRFFNPTFGRTSLGQLLPNLCSWVLTASLASMAVMIVIDWLLKPAPAGHPLGGWLHLWEWILMPAVGIALSALPGLVAHTRLLLGRYLQYKVTQKVAHPLDPQPVRLLEQVAVPVSAGGDFTALR